MLRQSVHDSYCYLGREREEKWRKDEVIESIDDLSVFRNKISINSTPKVSSRVLNSRNMMSVARTSLIWQQIKGLILKCRSIPFKKIKMRNAIILQKIHKSPGYFLSYSVNPGFLDSGYLQYKYGRKVCQEIQKDHSWNKIWQLGNKMPGWD